MKKIEHIGIAVKDIDYSSRLFSKILGKEVSKSENVESEGVTTSIFQIGESKIELVASTNSKSPIAKYLSKNKQGIHHLAIFVENIEQEIIRLKKEGIKFLNEIPKKGADNKLICFLHPKDTNGVLIELCQEAR